MTAAHAWRLFWSLPLVVQAWLVLLAVVVFAGVWSLSRGAGRLVGQIQERRLVPRVARLLWRRRQWRVRLARRGPRWWVDRHARVLLADLERAGDDLEEADHGRG